MNSPSRLNFSSFEMKDRSRDLALLAVVSILMLSYIWGWQHSFSGATAVFAVVLTGAFVFGHATDGRSLRNAGFAWTLSCTHLRYWRR